MKHQVKSGFIAISATYKYTVKRNNIPSGPTQEHKYSTVNKYETEDRQYTVLRVCGAVQRRATYYDILAA